MTVFIESSGHDNKFNRFTFSLILTGLIFFAELIGVLWKAAIPTSMPKKDLSTLARRSSV